MSQSITQLMAMGEYGFYVWSSYGLCAFVFLSMAMIIRRRGQKLKSELVEINASTS